MTTLIAPVPFVDPVVRHVRLEHDWSARLGVAAHITLLGPFLPPAEVTPETVRRLSDLLAGITAIPLSLRELRLLGTAACLLPDRSDHLERVTGLLEDAWPEVGRYRKRHHVTLARECGGELFERIRGQIAKHLPLTGEIDEAALLSRSTAGDVEVAARFRLSGP